MRSYSKGAVPGAGDEEKQADQTREQTSAKAAELRLKRNRDASQAMKDYEAAKLETLAKTARLRAERLARTANNLPSGKLSGAVKK